MEEQQGFKVSQPADCGHKWYILQVAEAWGTAGAGEGQGRGRGGAGERQGRGRGEAGEGQGRGRGGAGEGQRRGRGMGSCRGRGGCTHESLPFP
jgi:hypothetical protein